MAARSLDWRVQSHRLIAQCAEPTCGSTEPLASQCDIEDPIVADGIVSNLTVEQVNAFFSGLLAGAPTQGKNDPFLSQYERFLSRRFDRQIRPGRVLLVVGTGRNGSTTMAYALRQIPNSLVTHERPPLLHWHAPGPRLDFHAEFMRISREYFTIVGDVSHWWLPHISVLRETLGPIHVIYLHREFSATVSSFQRIKLRYNPPFNHWMPHHGEEWRPDPWDACYPNVLDKCVVLDHRDNEYMRSVCRFCISQYVKQYQLEASRLIEQHNGIELQLNSLFSPKSARLLVNYLGCDFRWQPVHLNRASTRDSATMRVFP